MRVLVTGATGKVGNAVARQLAEGGDEVLALVRDETRARPLLPPGVEPVRGDVEDPASLARAMEGVELVFNAMGIPEQWTPDEEVFDRVNAEGTGNVVRAAREAGVRRVVHTSTIDVFHAEQGGRFDETMLADYPKGTAYERSKQRAERLAFAERGDMDLVVVNPSAVYGPGPTGSASFERSMFEPLVKKRLPALPPGGAGLVFSEGVGRGHLLAAEKGSDGERYILCDTHASMRDLADTVVRVAGRGRVPFQLRPRAAMAAASVAESVSRITKKPPIGSRGQAYFFSWDAHPDSSKAQRELGWQPTPLDEGIRRTLEAMDPPLA